VALAQTDLRQVCAQPNATPTGGERTAVEIFLISPVVAPDKTARARGKNSDGGERECETPVAMAQFDAATGEKKQKADARQAKPASGHNHRLRAPSGWGGWKRTRMNRAPGGSAARVIAANRHMPGPKVNNKGARRSVVRGSNYERER